MFNNAPPQTGCSHLLLRLIRHKVSSLYREKHQPRGIARCSASVHLQEAEWGFPSPKLSYYYLLCLSLSCIVKQSPFLSQACSPPLRVPLSCPTPFCRGPCWDYIMVFLKFKTPDTLFLAEHSLVLLQGTSCALSTAPASTPHLKMASWRPVDHIHLTTPSNRAYIYMHVLYICQLYMISAFPPINLCCYRCTSSIFDDSFSDPHDTTLLLLKISYYPSPAAARTWSRRELNFQFGPQKRPVLHFVVKYCFQWI